LAAAGEYGLGALRGEGNFWAVPRRFYQLLFGVEALWLVLLTTALFAVAATVYYLLAARRREVALASPAFFVLAVAVTTAAVARFIATYDHPLMYANVVRARPFIVALGAGTTVAWIVAAAVLYGLTRKLGRWRIGKTVGGVAVLRVLSLALLVPFAGAELWTLVRAAGPRAHKPDIYLVVVDAFRADRLRAYGASRTLAPRLEALAAESVLFREAYTTSSWTKPAMASLFASVPPSTHRVTSRLVGMPEAAVTLVECLRATGYTTVGVSANPNITRPAGMADGFDVLDNGGGGSVLEGAGPPTFVARLLTRPVVTPGFLGPLWRPTRDGWELNRRLEFWTRLSGGSPRFFLVHYMEPHNPNLVRPEYAAELQPLMDRLSPDRLQPVMVGNYFFEQFARDPFFVPPYDDDEVALSVALYDADIRRMDVVVGDFLDRVLPLAASEEEPILVLLADHGEEFKEHGRWFHATSLHREVAEIPFLIRAPGYEPARVAGSVNLMDVAPTILALVGEPAAEGWEGEDLTPYLAGERPVPPRTLLLEGVHEMHFPKLDPPVHKLEFNGLVSPAYFYLKDENTGLEYLYDRQADPRQERNLVAETDHAAALAYLRGELARRREVARRRALTPAETFIPPGLERSLRALGYVR
jgi:arylsulfatase A-like enzyme